jgi:hypothetical protein
MSTSLTFVTCMAAKRVVMIFSTFQWGWAYGEGRH